MPKQQKNGYFFFMMEFKQREERRGRRFREGLKEIANDTKCKEEWGALTADERKAYNDHAKKLKMKVSTIGKLTGQGESLELIQKQEQQVREYEIMMKSHIDEIFDQAEVVNMLDTITFHLIHVNFFYTKTSIDSKTDYIPAEFAVLEFSLKNGVMRLYNQIISTNIELGYAREYSQISEETHKLNHDLPEGKSDYKEMCRDLINFLSHENKSKRLPPLYTSSKLKTIVPCLFKRMTEAAEMPQDTFKLYSLEYLLGSYIKYLNDDFPEHINRAIIAEGELAKEGYLYAPNIACPYHATIGAEHYCSQSIIHHWVYTFCDYCCPKLQVPMSRGIHCPENSDLPDDISIMSSMQSLSIREDKPSSVKSASGVSEAFRQARSGRSRAEDKQRKNRGEELTIIDYSNSSTNRSATATPVVTVEAAFMGYKPLRKPKTISKLLTNEIEVPEFNEKEFPGIGVGRGKPKNNSDNNANGTIRRKVDSK